MAPLTGDGFLRARPYVRRAMSGRIEELGDGWQVPPETWTRHAVTLPDALRGPGPHDVTLAARGDRLTLSIGGQVVATAQDARFPRGQAGVRLGGPGRLSFGRLAIREFADG